VCRTLVTSFKNQGGTQYVSVQNAEYETTSPQATSDDHVYLNYQM